MNFTKEFWNFDLLDDFFLASAGLTISLKFKFIN